MSLVPRDTWPRDTSLVHALSSARVRPATCIVNGVSNAEGTRVVKVASALVADTGGGRATVAEIGTGCQIPASTPSDMACSCDVGAIASVTATTSGLSRGENVSICTFVPVNQSVFVLLYLQRSGQSR